ncbi:MAG: hypothetical protein ABUK20_06205 [Anaerolineales bacterium]
MTKFWSITMTEARQLWRRRSFWIVQGILILPAAIFATFIFVYNSSTYDATGIGLGIPGQTTLFIYFLLIPILVSPAITRDLGKPGELLWSSPLEPLTHLAGTFCGLWLGLLPGVFLQIGAWWLAGLFVPSILSDLSWFYSLPTYLVTITVALSLSILFATLLRRTLIVLITWVVLWVILYFMVAGIDMFVPAQASSLFNIYFYNLQISPSLGLGPFRDLFFSMILWFAGISLSILCLALYLSLLTDHRKSIGKSRAVVVVSATAILLLSAGFLINRKAVSAHAMPPSPFDIQQELWQVDTNLMRVNVDADTGNVEGRSLMVLKPLQQIETNQVVLKLNPGLELQATQDGTGSALNVKREGDGVVIELLEPPGESLTLQFSWQGKLYLPVQAFGFRWKYPDAPGVYRNEIPRPPGALLFNRIGYLLRDGDWYPWPWIAGPRQAQVNQVTIYSDAENALSSVPMESGEASWEGEMPAVFLVFHPPGNEALGEGKIFFGSLSGSQQVEKSRLFAAAMSDLSPILGIKPAKNVVALPYLGNIIWTEDLLLVPDGSGFYTPKAFESALDSVISPQNHPLNTRVFYYALVRTWLFNLIPPEPEPYGHPTIEYEGKEIKDQSLDFPQHVWQEERGRWFQPPEVLDLKYVWNPRRSTYIKPSGEFASLAFWIAMELSDPDVMREDLDLMAYLDTPESEEAGRGARYTRQATQLWPYSLESKAARDVVKSFHAYGEKIGQERAIELVVQIIRELRPATVEELIAELETRSGVQFREK